MTTKGTGSNNILQRAKQIARLVLEQASTDAFISGTWCTDAKTLQLVSKFIIKVISKSRIRRSFHCRKWICKLIKKNSIHIITNKDKCGAAHMTARPAGKAVKVNYTETRSAISSRINVDGGIIAKA